MAFLGDKRYVEIVFDPLKWAVVVGDGGKATWTSISPSAGCVVTKSDGGTQPHVNCPPGSKVTTTNGTAILEIL
jgi:hypothetical protein